MLTIIADNGVPKVGALNVIQDMHNKMELVFYHILILLMLLILQTHYAKNGIKTFAKSVQIELIVITKMSVNKLITIVILMIDLMDFA